MSAILKTTAVLTGFAATASAIAYSVRTPTDFSQNALAAAEHSAPEVAAAKAKL